MAKSYPKIVRVHLTNFMSIKSATFEFDDSNILRFIGYNDVGKSAVRTALECAMMFSTPTKQKKFINDDANFFQVNIVFEDDVTISYERYESGRTVYELYVGTELEYSNKLRDGLYEKVTAVPQPIAEYLGLIDMPNGLSVNFGKRNDGLLLVGTSGSDNYLALSTVMKSEQISRAVKLLNTDNNNTRAKIQNLSIESSNYLSQVNALNPITPSLISAVKAENVRMKSVESRVSALSGVWDTVEELSTLDFIPAVEPVGTAGLKSIIKAVGNLNDYMSVVSSGSVGTISPVRVSLLNSLERSLNLLSQTSSDSAGFDVSSVEGWGTVSTDRFKAVVSARRNFKTVHDLDTELTNLESMASALLSTRAEYISSLRDEGYLVTECPKCHELSIVDSDGKTVVGGSHED